jgi:glycosyltransferase involved in cell wall biosynthesis
MPVHNGEQLIAQAIDSVLAQTEPDLELIIVNDGSTDGTRRLVEQRARQDPRIRPVNRLGASGRPAVPRNEGLALARGPFVSFLDHDDFYAPNRIQKLLAGLEANPSWVASFHDLQFVDEAGQPRRVTYLEDLDFFRAASGYLIPVNDGWYKCADRFYAFQSLRYAALHTQSVMIATNRIARDILRFDEKLLICDDTDLWIRLGMQGTIGFLPEVLSYYRLHGGSITSNKEKLIRDSIRLHIQNYRRVWPGFSVAERRLYRKKVSRYHGYLGYWYYDHGDNHSARTAYVEALKWYPNLFHGWSLAKSCLPATLVRWIRGRIKASRAFGAKASS